MEKVETACSLFQQGFNCAQALLVAYGAEFSVHREAALKIASGFGGGIAWSGDTCGAVTGALMVLGLRFGSTDPDREKKELLYVISREFIDRFKSRNSAGSVVCRSLIGFDLRPEEEMPRSERDVIEKQCPEFVRNAAEIIDELMETHNEK